MPFDSEVVYTPAPTAAAAPLSLTALIDAVADPDAGWAGEHPTRALAFLMVSPRDCAAVDAL